MQESHKLVKLPLVGDQAAQNQIDFEWPTKEIFEQMENQDSIRIKSIEIGHYINYNYYNLVTLKVTLSNGQ